MPWRMMRFLFIMALVILFIGLNAGYSSDIRFWFGEKASFQNVPIYVSLFGAYLLGALSVIPFAVNRSISRLKKKKKKQKAEKESVDKTTTA
ncbi:hypothetical protein [Spirochaeta isovalerica]|uniref:Putative integral membrane protein n=1 Tax=Spirochaeta isovalerica TaxID=150 RepID=A0A841R6D2_9SPIO|nr:hypothetical protein [Spirochaeta isovalerica]MBB6478559.1 putative integral membrane protein [Spirochaeta isovalerica]